MIRDIYECELTPSESALWKSGDLNGLITLLNSDEAGWNQRYKIINTCWAMENAINSNNMETVRFIFEHISIAPYYLEKYLLMNALHRNIAMLDAFHSEFYAYCKNGNNKAIEPHHIGETLARELADTSFLKLWCVLQPEGGDNILAASRFIQLIHDMPSWFIYKKEIIDYAVYNWDNMRYDDWLSIASNQDATLKNMILSRLSDF